MKKTNKILLPFVTMAILLSSCTQDPTDKITIDILSKVSKASNTLPKIDKGAISGSIFDKTAATTNEISESIIKIIRAEDIYELDDKGNPKKDKAQKEIVIEKKGQVLQTIKLKEKNQFLVTDLLPGAISVLVTKRQENIQVDSVIEVGKTTQIKQVIFGSQQADKAIITSINVSGKVVYVDGRPVKGAKVADVTGGFTNNSTITDENGKFTLTENPFTNPRSLDVSLGDPNASGSLFTSYSVSSDRTEDITIPLLADSRFVSGRVLDSVLKTKPITGLVVKVDGTNISTVTDADGTFRLKGVPLSSVNISLGGVKGFIDKSMAIEPAQTNDEKKLGEVFITPLGSVLVNLIAENSPIMRYNSLTGETYYSTSTGELTFPPEHQTAPAAAGSPPKFDCQKTIRYSGETTPILRPIPNYVNLPTDVNGGSCQYINGIKYKVAVPGVIQFEGTDIKIPFSYPVTPEREITIFSGLDKQTINLPAPNESFSIPVSDIPGGEYTISVSLAHHETQKGVKLIVPSNDIAATELIQMRLVKSVTGMGDIRGKVIVKNVDGTTVGIPSGIVIAAIRSDEEVLTPTRVEQILNDSAGDINYSKANVASDGTYNMQNVQSGTRIIIAGVITNGKLDTNIIPNAYVLVNVTTGSITKAPDIVLTQR